MEDVSSQIRKTVSLVSKVFKPKRLSTQKAPRAWGNISNPNPIQMPLGSPTRPPPAPPGRNRSETVDSGGDVSFTASTYTSDDDALESVAITKRVIPNLASIAGPQAAVQEGSENVNIESIVEAFEEENDAESSKAGDLTSYSRVSAVTAPGSEEPIVTAQVNESVSSFSLSDISAAKEPDFPAEQDILAS
jgi:hypothetical protein